MRPIALLFLIPILSGTVPATGRAECTLDPTFIDFGPVAIGDTVASDVLLTNTGTVLLIAEPSVPNQKHFSVFPTNIRVDPGETVSFTIRFHPHAEGNLSLTVGTGRYSTCGGVSVQGEGYRKCAIVKSPTSYGQVVIGEHERRSFFIHTTKEEPVSGRIRLEDCLQNRFYVESGGGPFTIEPGEVHTFVVTFAPWDQRKYTCWVETGLACGGFEIYGAGVDEPLFNPHPDAAITMAIQPHDDRSPCRVAKGSRDIPCVEYRTSGELNTGYDAYVVLTGGNPEVGFAGTDFGVGYNDEPGAGVDVYSWISCTDLEFPTDDWPRSGSGNLLTWNHETNCQRDLISGRDGLGVHAVVGSFYITAYSLDILKITPRIPAEDQGPHVSTCDALVNVVHAANLGEAVFADGGGIPGCNPCIHDCPEIDPLCTVYPPSLDFGAVYPISHADRTMSVLNPFEFPISGTVELQSPEFAVLRGGGKFTLGPGEIHEFVVRFTPPNQDVVERTMSIPPLCTSVTLRGGGDDSSPADPPVPVRITGLAAVWEGRTAVVSWRVLDAADHLGFHVYREDDSEDRILLSDRVLSGRSAYAFEDPDPPRTGGAYWLSEIARDGSVTWIGPVSLPPYRGPTSLALRAGQPNPFRAGTSIRFDIPSGGPVVLSVHDIAGREVIRLVDGHLPSGTHEAAWDGRGRTGERVSAGIYLIRLATADGLKSRKLVKVE